VEVRKPNYLVLAQSFSLSEVCEQHMPLPHATDQLALEGNSDVGLDINTWLRNKTRNIF
jgi:hypothetical protein